MNNKNKDLDFIKNNNIDVKKKEANENRNNTIEDENELNQKILKIKKNIINIKLREQAEIENIKKNTYNKIKEIKKMQFQYFCINFIPILDNLKNIKNTAHKLNIKHNKIIEGITLTLKLLLDTIQKFDLTIENQKHIKFNALLHQTESNEKLDDIHTYYVSSVIKDGYICQGEIIRKATVKVHKEKNNI
ncbi:MAG: nucleotide exchange factor GrpE [Buchnera aphidicola (Kaburagia rhusicola rhusicola)]